MGGPWGISDQEFLAIFGGLIVLPLVVMLVWRVLLKVRPSGDATVPDVFHYAYLAGGPVRVADTAIAALIAGERLRIGTGGVLHVIGDDMPADPVEGAVWRTVKDTTWVTLVLVRRTFHYHGAVADIADCLAERGMIISASSLVKARRTTVWLYLVVLALGIARWIEGVRLHRPLVMLTLLIVAAVGVALTVGLSGRRPWIRRTTRGVSRLRHAVAWKFRVACRSCWGGRGRRSGRISRRRDPENLGRVLGQDHDRP